MHYAGRKVTQFASRIDKKAGWLAAADHDVRVCAAFEAGGSKSVISRLTDIARTTIDRIVSADVTATAQGRARAHDAWSDGISLLFDLDRSRAGNREAHLSAPAQYIQAGTAPHS